MAGIADEPRLQGFVRKLEGFIDRGDIDRKFVAPDQSPGTVRDDVIRYIVHTVAEFDFWYFDPEDDRNSWLSDPKGKGGEFKSLLRDIVEFNLDGMRASGELGPQGTVLSVEPDVEDVVSQLTGLIVNWEKWYYDHKVQVEKNAWWEAAAADVEIYTDAYGRSRSSRELEGTDAYSPENEPWPDVEFESFLEDVPGETPVGEVTEGNETILTDPARLKNKVPFDSEGVVGLKLVGPVALVDEVPDCWKFHQLGQHDQCAHSTSGSCGFLLRRGKAPEQTDREGWSRLDDKRPITQIHSGNGKTVDGIPAVKVTEITAKNGNKLRLYEHEKTAMNETDRKDLLNTAAFFNEQYPKGLGRNNKIVVVSDAGMARLRGGPSRAVGVTNSGIRDRILINGDRVRGGDKSKAAIGNGWAMPVRDNHSLATYVYAHEMGHQYDFSNNRKAARGMFKQTGIKTSLSEYGRTTEREGYAEAFAEWHLTQGQTDNFAANAYARHESWTGVGLTSSGHVFQIDEEEAVAEPTEDSTFDPTTWEFPEGSVTIFDTFDGETPPVTVGPELEEPTPEELEVARKIQEELWKEYNLGKLPGTSSE